MKLAAGILAACGVFLLAGCSGGGSGAAASASAAADGTPTTTGGASGTQVATPNPADAPVVSASNPYGVPFPPTPNPDPFYAKPDPMPDVPPGTILKSRKVTFKPLAGIPLPNPAWQIQYMSRDVNGKPLPVVETVVKPLLPTLSGKPEVLSYQLAYDSLGSSCTPSQSLTGNTANADNQEETLIYLLGHQLFGWTMVFPDYEGPYNAYGAGRLAGQATLDGIRAALSFKPLGLTPKTPVAMWGYSGGALATAWAATLQPTYAPELNIVGAASGGTPADTFSVVDSTQNGPFFNLIFSAVVGTDRAYPELLPQDLLTASGIKTIDSEKDSCTAGGPLFGLSAPANFTDYLTVKDPFATPGAQAIHAAVTLPQTGMSPKIDMYVYHEVLDEIIPIAGTTKMVDAWCQAGTPVAYDRELGGEHVLGTATGAPGAFLYLVGRFMGQHIVPPTAKTCNY
ncbi:MAG TPA: lipase family protein [Nevskiaceae bacterium]|nr:lipase family protein [Nevskiaceae bacterium]